MILSTPACPGPPLDPRLTSTVPPNVDLLWDRPSTADMWSFMYRIDWQNGTSAVGDTTDMHGTLSGLKAVTEYAVTITAFTDSTLCLEQSINFTFSTTQSECSLGCWLISGHNVCAYTYSYTCKFIPCTKFNQLSNMSLIYSHNVFNIYRMKYCNWYYV